jgi:hypothetical protein
VRVGVEVPQMWWGEAPERTWRLLREREYWNKLSRFGSMGPPSRFQGMAAIQGFGIGLNNVQPAIDNPSKRRTLGRGSATFGAVHRKFYDHRLPCARFEEAPEPRPTNDGNCLRRRAFGLSIGFKGLELSFCYESYRDFEQTGPSSGTMLCGWPLD